MLRDEDRITLAAEQVSCDLDGEAAILSLENGLYYGLNRVGTRVWALLKAGPQTVGELRQCILEEYDVGFDACDRDVRSLIEELGRHGLVKIGA